MANAPRSLEVRLTEYRDALRDTADGIENLLTLLAMQDPALDPAVNREEYDAKVSLEATVALHRHIADDVTKIMRGEELPRWGIVGEVPR